jgi:hypothetical protein
MNFIMNSIDVKKYFFLLFPALFIFFASCGGSNPNTEKKTPGPDSALIKALNGVNIDTAEKHKFDAYTKVEVISFHFKDWKEFREGKREKLGVNVRNAPDKDYVKYIPVQDRVTLTAEQVKELAAISRLDKNLPCEENWGQTKCYTPRHAILFYKDHEVVGYFEICFHCGNFRNYTDYQFCGAAIGRYKTLFQQAGVTYFGEE